QKLLKVDPAEHEQTKLAVVGNAALFRASADLLAAQAADKGWPELAQFDCSACHHDLKNPSWRQQRGYAGTPGRPRPREWPAALIATALRQAGEGSDADQFTERTAKLNDALAARPFGKPDAVAPAARKLAEWSETNIKRLGQQKYDQARSLR